MEGEGGVVDGREARREAGPAGVVAVLIPPAVLDEVQAVLDPPVAAGVPQQVGGGDLIRVEAAGEVACVTRDEPAAGVA